MAEYTDSKVPLIINKISRSKYNELKANHNLDDSQIYMVEESSIYVGGEQIKDVGMPTENGDAVNKVYVDNNTLNVNVAQTLDDAQKLQARENIGAVSSTDVKQVILNAISSIDNLQESYSLNDVADKINTILSALKNIS